ncbi:hypothetical protein HY572_04730 [Candidatus Micrarchaeota archaeon]|nr:hypothetical protein [Candidatus Micrarchaeota archaeon]
MDEYIKSAEWLDRKLEEHGLVGERLTRHKLGIRNFVYPTVGRQQLVEPHLTYPPEYLEEQLGDLVREYIKNAVEGNQYWHPKGEWSEK